MSFFNLKLIKKSENLLLLTIPVYSRLIILIFAAAVALTFLLEPGFSIFPLLILITLLLSACYKESWSFDKSTSKIVYGFGLIFLYKKTIVDFDLVEKFVIEGFVKGSLAKKPAEIDEKKRKLFETEFFKFSLMNKELGELTINTVKGKQRDFLYSYAGEIALLCRKKLVEE